MNKNKILGVLIVILLLNLSFVVFNKVQIALPNASDLKNIILSKSTEGNNTYTTITNRNEINSILDSIRLSSNQTNLASVNDAPTNIDDYIILEFSYYTGGRSIAYLYKTKNIYYIEQPYINIWEITKGSYDNISTLLNNK